MNITKLCDCIELQPEIKSCVLAFAEHFDFGTVDRQLKDFLVYEKMKDAQIELCSLQRNIKKHLLSGGVIRNAYGRLLKFDK